MNVDRVIIKPVLTEKGTKLANNQEYMFEVNIMANKNQVRKTLEKLYKVKVSGVKIMVRKGKTRRVGRRMTTKQLADRKIAFVKLREGKIDLFPQA